MARALIATAMVACLAAQGCSLVTVKRPNKAGVFEGGECTEERDMPWWDAIIAGTAGAIGFGVMISALGGENTTGKGLLAAGMLGTGAAFGYSAYRGFEWTKKCREQGGSSGTPSSDI